MWNMPLERIADLRPPIVLYAVGYNRFEGEPDPLPAMVDFFDLLDKKDALVAFRNDGSLARLANDLPALADRYREVPDPGLFCRSPLPRSRDHVLIQIATDRVPFRYPSGIDDFVEFLRKLLDAVPGPKKLVPHTESDAKIYAKLAHQLPVDEIAPLCNSLAETEMVMGWYRSARFTVSTRGHAQICSVGNGTPTFCISTHPKAAGFMQSAGLSEATFDYLHEPASDASPRLEHFIQQLPAIESHIDDLNRRWDAEIGAFNQQVVERVSG
jgi:hypothetical protein